MVDTTEYLYVSFSFSKRFLINSSLIENNQLVQAIFKSLILLYKK